MQLGRSIRIVGLGLGGALALGIAAPASAGISCTVSSAGLAFGVYNVLAATATVSTGTVTVNCTGDTEPATDRIIHLSAGGSGDHGARRMLSGADQLSYQVYSDAAHSIVWGDGTNGSGAVGVSVAVPGSGSATLYGRVPANQSVPPGSYLDTITATVHF